MRSIVAPGRCLGGVFRSALPCSVSSSCHRPPPRRRTSSSPRLAPPLVAVSCSVMAPPPCAQGCWRCTRGSGCATRTTACTSSRARDAGRRHGGVLAQKEGRTLSGCGPPLLSGSVQCDETLSLTRPQASASTTVGLSGSDSASIFPIISDCRDHWELVIR